MDSIIRQRFLQDRVLTATPAQRVVMLYDRLALDLARARTDEDSHPHLDHAALIVSELLSSLDMSVGGPAENLATLYGWMLREILGAQLSGETGNLTVVESSTWTLRDTWAAVAGQAAQCAPGEQRPATFPVQAASPASSALAGMGWTA